MTQQTEKKLDTRFTVADWLVEPDALRIVRGDNEKKLEPKVMQVLVYLAQNNGQVVTRTQLEDTVWKGMVVGYDSLGSTVIKLRKAFNDDPRNPAVIQTIPKKGYRIIAPVRFVADESSSSADKSAQGQNSKLKHAATKIPVLIMLAFIVIVVPVMVLVLNSGPSKKPAPEQPVIPRLVVLPFKNLSDDPQQDYFSDGITADLITDLASINKIQVIARNSSFVYKNVDINVQRIKQELNVDYLIEGSVRKANNKVRISAGLIDTSSGVNLWATRFDTEFDNVLSIQDEVVEKIVSSLEITLSKQEKDKIAASYTTSVIAYDTFLQGWQYFWRYTPEGNTQAREYYLKAIELDPNFARAHANIGATYAFDFMNGWSENPEHSLQQAHIYINKAVQIDDTLPQVQWAVGIVNTYSRNYEVAIKAAEKAIILAPNFADGYGLLATVLNYAGKPQKAKPIMRKAMLLDPRHPFIFKMILGQIHFNLREYEKAVSLFTQATERNPTAQEVRLWLAATYAYLDKDSDASWELEQIRNSGVVLSAEFLEQIIPVKDPTLRKHLIDGLLKAGLKVHQ